MRPNFVQDQLASISLLYHFTGDSYLQIRCPGWPQFFSFGLLLKQAKCASDDGSASEASVRCLRCLIAGDVSRSDRCFNQIANSLRIAGSTTWLQPSLPLFSDARTAYSAKRNRPLNVICIQRCEIRFTKNKARTKDSNFVLMNMQGYART